MEQSESPDKCLCTIINSFHAHRAEVQKKKEGKKKKKEETIVLLLQSAGLVYSPHNTDACRMDTLAL